jgi:hypothetical protein
MPQLTSAATHQGLLFSSFRCAYQAKVMKMFDKTSRMMKPIAGVGKKEVIGQYLFTS